MKSTYRIADKTFEVDCLYGYFPKMAKDYRFDANPEFSIVITDDDIHQEKKLAVKAGDYHGESNDYLESLTVLRKLMKVLIPQGYLLFHGSLIEIDKKGYLFTAKSGVGKTTHTVLYKKWLGDRVTIVNGDKPILKIAGDGVVAYGTPWCGKEGWNRNTSVKLSSICYLNRGKENKIEPLSIEDAFPILYSQTHRDTEFGKETLSLVSQLSSSVNLYHLNCNMEEDAPKVSYRGMQKELTFEDILDLDGVLIYTARGTSMQPLIHEKEDLLTIVKPQKKIEPYDIVLFKRSSGQYVLHRCLEVRDTGYVMCGDNQYRKEYDVKDSQVLGVLISITRNGKTLNMDDPSYLEYVHRQCDHFTWRAFKLWNQEFPSRVKRKLSKKK